MSEEVFLFWTLRKYYTGAATPPIVTDNSGNEYKRVSVPQWNVIGVTDDINIPFCGYTKSGYTSYPNKFYPEECYLIEFEFFNTGTPAQNATPLKTIKKAFIATELMNDLTVNRFDLVYFNDWMKNYDNHIKNPRINASGTVGTITSGSDSLVIGEGYNVWISDSGLKNYRTFTDGRDYEDYMKSGFNAAVSVNCPITLTYSSPVQVLSGPLWDDLNSHLKLSYNIDGAQVSAAVSADTGIATTTGTKSLVKKAGFGNKYRFVQESDTDLDIWNYETRDVMAPVIYLNAEGLWESGALSNPDIRLSGTQIDTQTYTTNVEDDRACQTARELVSIINSGTNDLLFLRLRMDKQTIGDKDPNYNYLRFKVRNSGTVYAAADATTAADDTFYAVFKIIYSTSYYRLGFVKINRSEEDAARGLFTTWTSGIKHIICDDDSLITGGFYSVDKIGDYSDDTVKIKLGGKLKPSSFMYLGHNMLDEASRSHLTSLYRDSNNNYITNNFTVDPNNSAKFFFKETEFEPVEEQFNIDLSSFTSQSASLDDLDDKIALRNLSVQDDISRYAVDSILTSNEYSSTSNVYVYQTNATIRSYVLLDLLNDRLMTDVPLMFEAEDVNNGVHHTQRVHIGVVDETIILT